MTLSHRFVVLGSLAADSLALGAHWIYDTHQIDQEIGRVGDLRAPLSTSFHPHKTRGDLTHYGDQTIWLLQSLAEAGGFSLRSFAELWQAMLKDYTGYRDHATKDTLQGFKEGRSAEAAGSTSSDLGGAARIAPLVFFYQNDVEAMTAAARQQTAMTHRNSDVVESAAFFARVTACVMDGQDPRSALKSVTQRHFNRSPFDRWVADGIESCGRTTREAVGKFGQACDVTAAFPSVVHLIAKYQDQPREGLIENVMAGGDSAARGLIAGMVFGAFSGADAVAQDWVADINQRAAVEGFLDTLAAIG
jgi:ADP-ribosylglycohydrolase